MTKGEQRITLPGGASASARIGTLLLAGLLSLGGGIVLGQAVSPPSTRQLVVQATRGWQDSGLAVPVGGHVRVMQVGGQWTEQAGGVPDHDAASLQRGYICAQAMAVEACQEPVPNAPQGALVGKLGSEVFLVGAAHDFTAARAGRLLLRINDPDAGLGDNAGALTVTVTLVSR